MDTSQVFYTANLYGTLAYLVIVTSVVVITLVPFWRRNRDRSAAYWEGVRSVLIPHLVALYVPFLVFQAVIVTGFYLGSRI